jgi:hypothetical protein
MGYTGKIVLMGVDECGDPFHIKDFQLHGDLETFAELNAWQSAKIDQVREKFQEANGFNWIDHLRNPELEEEEREAEYQRFLTEIFPTLVADGIYPEDWDPDDAYDEYIYDKYIRERHDPYC